MIHPQAIESYLEQNLPAYLNILQQMVAINSYTVNPSGVNALADLTAETFAGLGFTAEKVPSVNPAYGSHLILTRPGTSDRRIGLVSHLDTVYSPEEEAQNDFIWREADQRIYGPGTVDIKGGTVSIYMLLAALQEFAPHAFAQITWVILLDASEERGGIDFGELCIDRLDREALACLVFEGGKYEENRFRIVVARKGMAVYRVTVEGKAAHAGNDHAYGANAIIQLADVMQQIAAMTDYERQLTFNVGVVRGGATTNRVPHQAEALVEMRAFEVDIFEAGIAGMLALNDYSTVRSVAGDFACRVRVEILTKVPPWSRNPASERLLNVWQETAQSMGMTVEPEERGGLSDGNHVWQHLPTLDGLGPSGANMHCSERSADGSKDQEYVDAASFVPKTVLNTMALLRLIKEAR